MSTLLIRQGTVIDPENGIFGEQDVLVAAGKISAVTEQYTEPLPEGTEILDAKGKWVMPGLIDLHVHFRDPGLTYKETIATGCAAAAAGGYTTVCTMPNTKPVADSPDVIAYELAEAEKAGLARVLPIGAVTYGQKGEQNVDFAVLRKAGICAVSEDGQSVADAGLMKQAMQRCAELGVPIFDHCEEKALAGGCINDGEASAVLGLPGLSRDAENAMTAREILLAASTGAQLHICHVSTKECVAMIRFAKAQGIPVTAEVCPHHFSLTDTDILENAKTREDADQKNADGTDTTVPRHPVKLLSNLKMNPPLRTEEDVQAILEGLQDGTLEVISTDHAPHSREEKTDDLRTSMNGIIGLETAFAVTKQTLVDTGLITPSDLVRLMSTNPAKVLWGADAAHHGGTLAVGAPADICIADPDEEYTVGDTFASKATNSPYIGWRMKGRVIRTILGGRTVWEV